MQRRSELFFSYALLAALLIAAFFHLTRDIRDPDFFWHLKTGEWIWQHKALPSSDPFSFVTRPIPAARDAVILTSYWLSQLIYYLFYSLSGMAGIVFLRFIVAGVLLSIMLKRREGDSLIYIPLLLFFFAVLLKSCPIERPQVFSFLFFAALLYGIRRIREKRESIPYFRVLFIPSLMLLWANVHAGYVAGLSVILLYIVCETVKILFGDSGPAAKKTSEDLILTGVLSVAVSFINPNSYHVFSDNIIFQHDYMTAGNIEFFSPLRIFLMFRDYSVLVYFFILGLASLCLLTNFGRADLGEAALIAGTGLVSLTTLRYVPFFLIAALPFVSKILAQTRLAGQVRVGLCILSFFVIIFFTVPFANFEHIHSGGWVSKRKYPVGAADFIASHELRGNMYNFYNWGGYLIWRFGPERKVFIDGRNLSGETYVQSQALDGGDESDFDGRPLWKAILDYYAVDYIVIPGSLPIARRLLEDPAWHPVFADSVSYVFQRNGFGVPAAQ